MSSTNKITVRVTPSAKKQNVQVRTTGKWGKVSLSGMTISLPDAVLTVPTTAEQYWTSILNQVLAAIP